MKQSNKHIYSKVALLSILPTMFIYSSLNQPAEMDELASLYSTEPVSVKYVSKKDCIVGELKSFTEGKKLDAKEMNKANTKAARNCKAFDTIPKSTENENSPAHTGPSVQGDERLPNFKVIAYSTPERGKIFVSLKNVGSAYTGSPVKYYVQTWGNAQYKSEINADYSNSAVMKELGMAEAKGIFGTNIFSENGVSFLLFTNANTGLQIRKSANPFHFCVDPENKIKESDESDNCTDYEWTELKYSGDIFIQSAKFKNGRFDVVVKKSGDTVYEDIAAIDKLNLLLIVDGRLVKNGEKEIDHIFRSDRFEDYVNVSPDLSEFGAGTYKAKMCLDTKSVLSEIDETNNCHEFDFTK